MKSKAEMNGLFYDVLENLDALVELNFYGRLTEGEVIGLYASLRKLRQEIRAIRKHVGDIYESR